MLIDLMMMTIKMEIVMLIDVTLDCDDDDDDDGGTAASIYFDNI